MFDLTYKRADEAQFTALYGIFSLAGEHMHRTLGLSHWYPFPPSDRFVERIQGRDVYAVYTNDVLIGTFNLGYQPEPYYLDDMAHYWQDTAAEALYFSGFALLPAFQQKGIGTWCMTQVDQIVRAANAPYIRFDGVYRHDRLMRFYSRLGYEQRGVLPVGSVSVMCYEKAFIG